MPGIERRERCRIPLLLPIEYYLIDSDFRLIGYLQMGYINRVVEEKKDDGAGFNLEGMKEFMDSRSPDLIHGPGIPSQEAGEAGEGSRKKRARQGLEHGGGVPLFSQLDEAQDEGRKSLNEGLEKASRNQDNMSRTSCLAWSIRIDCSPFRANLKLGGFNVSMVCERGAEYRAEGGGLRIKWVP
jgi:hypothetical protein